MREQETDRVLIVGGGPVGLVLALVLARHGAGSLVLEARPAPTPAEESRAITWMPRGLELLGWLGLAERFRERGLARHAHQFHARSTVRRQLAVPARHRDYGAFPAVADFELADPADPAESFVDLDPARPWGCSASPLGAGGSSTGSTRRGPRGHGDEPAATRILRERCPAAAPRRLLWASAFRLGQGQSARYRVGRWLLAGDAAHAMGPSAGAGMMLGVFGAWRLGWRLARVTVDAAPQELLDDYGREQRAAAAQVQQANARIFRNLAVRSRP